MVAVGDRKEWAPHAPPSISAVVVAVAAAAPSDAGVRGPWVDVCVDDDTPATVSAAVMVTTAQVRAALFTAEGRRRGRTAPGLIGRGVIGEKNRPSTHTWGGGVHVG